MRADTLDDARAVPDCTTATGVLSLDVSLAETAGTAVILEMAVELLSL